MGRIYELGITTQNKNEELPYLLRVYKVGKDVKQ